MMNPPTRPTRARRRSRNPLRRFLYLGLLLTPILGALTFFGLVLASQAAFGLGGPALDQAGLQQLAQEWLGIPAPPPVPTPVIQPTAHSARLGWTRSSLKACREWGLPASSKAPSQCRR